MTIDECLNALEAPPPATPADRLKLVVSLTGHLLKLKEYEEAERDERKSFKAIRQAIVRYIKKQG